MGLFNTGKNDKVEKVEKYEEHHRGSPPKPHHRSSKHHHAKKFNGALVRPMPQPSLMPNQFPATFGYQQSLFPNPTQFKYPFSSNTPYDLSKFLPSSTPFNPFVSAQPPSTNFAPMWSNGFAQFNDRSPFQQQQQLPLNFYQQNAFSYLQPSTNGYLPPFKF